MLQRTKTLIALTVFSLSTFAHAAPKAPRPKNLKNAYHEKMEAVYCAPGMPCYDSKMQSNLDLLIPVAGFGAKAADPRKTVKRIKGSEAGKTGSIENMTLGFEATVVLVGECYALTNAHVITGSKKTSRTLRGWPQDKSVIDKVQLKLKFGQGNQDGYAKIVSGKVATIGDYDSRAPLVDEDWALIHLDECVGKQSEYGFYPITPLSRDRASQIGNKGILVSHHGDKDPSAGVQIQEGCGNIMRDAEGGPDTWGHNCNAWDGSSGGGFMLRNQKTNKLHLVALNASGVSKWFDQQEYNEYTSNSAVSMEHVYPKIKPYLEGQQIAALPQRVQTN